MGSFMNEYDKNPGGFDALIEVILVLLAPLGILLAPLLLLGLLFGGKNERSGQS